MNLLQNYIILNGLSETDTMNKLQDQGIISDNCVNAEDVANVNCDRAVEWLEENP